MTDGLVHVCMKPTKVVLPAFPINSGKIALLLGEVFKREEAGSFSLKILLNSNDNTKSNDYNDNKICGIIIELLLHASF